MTGVQHLFAWLIATGWLSIAGMIVGTRLENTPLVISAAAMFTIVAIVAGWRINMALRAVPAARVTPEAAPIAARRNARLFALTYAWGGLSMLAVYYFTGLHWQHAWQYGAAMLLIGASLYLYSAALASPASPAREERWLIAVQRLTQLQGIAALAGIAFLVGSGKLTAGKSDWAANVLFVAGGVTIAALSFVTSHTQRQLMRPGARKI
jgi:glucose-6-phosphate-specific signal transduction histidine kinase